MARGQRKTIEEKILQKQEMINNLSARIENEQNELQALVNEQKAARSRNTIRLHQNV